MDEFESEDTNETGGSLRSKLETALQEKRELAKELRGFKAKDVIAAKGLKYVTPDDLHDVDLSELESKAAEIDKRKSDERANVLRQVFAEQGFAEDELDDKVAQFLSPPEESVAEVSARVASLGQMQGKPVDTSTKGLEGPDLIYAALAEKGAKNRR